MNTFPSQFMRDISGASLLYNDLLRDGGSAVIILELNSQRIKLRKMRSLAERKRDDFNKIELSLEGEIVAICLDGSQILGFDDMWLKIKDSLKDNVQIAFGYTT